MHTSHLFVPKRPSPPAIDIEQASELVYRLDGYIMHAEADSARGTPSEWVYVAADGQETGLRSQVSADSLRAEILRNATQ